MILHISRCANNVIILKYVIFIIETGKIDMAVCCCCFFGRTYVPRTQTERHQLQTHYSHSLSLSRAHGAYVYYISNMYLCYQEENEVPWINRFFSLSLSVWRCAPCSLPSAVMCCAVRWVSTSLSFFLLLCFRCSRAYHAYQPSPPSPVCAKRCDQI